MSVSPSKRRRTSVGTIQVSTTRKNFGEQNEDEPDRTAGPASYMSPTKASLARSHPHLLPRTEPVPRSKGKLLLEQRISALKSNQNNTIYPASDKIHPTVQPVVNAEDQEPGASPPEAGNEDPTEIAHSTQQGPVLEKTEASQVKCPSQNSEESSPAIVESVFPALSDATATERLTESVDNVRETTGHSNTEKPALPSTPVKTVNHEIDVAEPRLPSTPRQLGLEPPARKPTGPLSLSPRPKRKLRRHSSIKSSPLKPKEAAAVQQIVETQEESSLGPCRSFSDYASNSSIEKAQGLPLSEHHSGTEFPTVPMRASKNLASSDPLFNLQASLSLAVSASDEIEPIQGELNRLRSRVVMLSSTDSILVVKLRIFLKQSSNKVASILILQLSPWTASELGSWLKAPVTDRSQGAIAKAISRYWDMAETRAFCWYECEQDFGHLINTTETREHPDDEPADINGGQMESAVGDNNDMNLKAIGVPKAPCDLGGDSSGAPPHLLGRQSLGFSDSIALLDISWIISFTPGGEATSIVSARASYPESWSGEAVFNDLARTGEAFARLVKAGNTVHEAVSSLIGVVFPS